MTNINITRAGTVPKLAVTNVSYQPDGKDIDDVVYYLICAADKMNNENPVEQSLALPRLEHAFNDLRKIIIKLKKGNGTNEK
jgi:hypothetical protein